MKKRITYHILFWLVYFVVILYNDLFLSPSFKNDPSWHIFGLAFLSDLILLPVKIVVVYYVLYSFIPRWIKASRKVILTTEVIGVVIFAVFIYRIIVQYIVWPHIFGESAQFDILNYFARYLHSFLELLQITGLAATIKLFRLRMAAAKREKEVVQEKLTSEIRHLKAQINPHFLFNSLNIIFSLSRSRSEKTSDVVLKLSDILRYMLYESEKKTTSISDEIKIITDYIDLQQLRFGDRLQIEKTITIDNPALQITPLLLLPLIENAFKHGAGSVNGEIRIVIKLVTSGAQLQLYIENPFSAPVLSPEKKEGIGLNNIRRQLELLYTDYLLTFGENGGLFVVNLTINLNSYATAELFDR